MDEHLEQQLLLGREHYAKHEYDKAEPLLRRVAQQTDRYADVFDMLGVIAHAAGNLALARDWFERALVLNANYTEAQLNLLLTLNDLGEHDEARKIYATMQRRGTHRQAADAFAKGKIANLHADISQAYGEVGMHLEAIRELEKAVSLCPTFPDLRTKLGTLYRDAGDRRGARQQFEAAREHNPDYAQARLMLGVLHLSDGEHALAEGEFSAVLERDPNNTNARMYLRVVRGEIGTAASREGTSPKGKSD